MSQFAQKHLETQTVVFQLYQQLIPYTIVPQV